MSREEEQDSRESGLAHAGGKVRLFVESELGAGLSLKPSPGQAHYLLRVMRAGAGDRLLLFNGRDGEWRAAIAAVSKRGCEFRCEARTQVQSDVPDIWLAFAPIKRTPADYVSQKATELGVRVLQPVITRRSVARRVNLERMRANAIEAAEQSGRLNVPEVRAPLELNALLQSWPDSRRMIFCDEGGEAPSIAGALAHARSAGGWGVLTGPEGGFDAGERAAIRSRSYVLPVSLGPRIMRADTAALAALAVWQAVCGDWRDVL